MFDIVDPQNSSQVRLFNPLSTEFLYNCSMVILESKPAWLFQFTEIPVMVRYESVSLHVGVEIGLRAKMMSLSGTQFSWIFELYIGVPEAGSPARKVPVVSATAPPTLPPLYMLEGIAGRLTVR